MSYRSSVEQKQSQHNRNIRTAIWTSVVVIGLVGVILLAKLVASQPATPGTATSSSTLAPAALVGKIVNLQLSEFSGIGQGTATVLPKAITAPALTNNSKPSVVYIGAEYCPYCATERWPMVVALSRFGTFSNLGVTNSASGDVYPNTQTFSFHGASYTSKYIDFRGVETQSNVQSGSSYAALDSLTAAEQKILSTYDATPYVASSSAGSIPFIDFGGKYLISGSTYDPAVLKGKTADQIASALTDTTSPISKGVMGASNTIVAAICSLTNNQPSDVCQIQQDNGLSAKIAVSTN